MMDRYSAVCSTEQEAINLRFADDVAALAYLFYVGRLHGFGGGILAGKGPDAMDTWRSRCRGCMTQPTVRDAAQHLLASMGSAWARVAVADELFLRDLERTSIYWPTMRSKVEEALQGASMISDWFAEIKAGAVEDPADLADIPENIRIRMEVT